MRKKYYEYKGEMLTLPVIAMKTGVPYNNLYRRLRSGMTLDEAIIPNYRKHYRPSVEYKGELMSYMELSRRAGIPYGRLYMRINRLGMSPEQAVENRKETVKVKAKCPYPDCDNCPFADCIA